MKTGLIRKEKAQGMVEFALVLPLLLLVMFAVVEFGRLLLIYSAVFSASRDAARYGAASGSPGNYIPYYQDCAGMRAAARRFGSLVGIQDTNITISYDDGSGNSLGVCPSGATNVRLGATTSSPALCPSSALPNGDSAEIRPCSGSASADPTTR